METHYQTQRLPLVDILRGWALLGVILMNYLGFYYMHGNYKAPKDALSMGLEYVAQYGFSSKSWTLLSLLFGYGFSVFLTKATASFGSPYWAFSKRMLWLLAFAFLNTLFFHGDILRDYAVLGLLLLLMYRLNTKTILLSAAALSVTVPFISAYLRKNVKFPDTEHLYTLFTNSDLLSLFRYNLADNYYGGVVNPHYLITVHVVMFICMLVGVAAHRTDFFNKIVEERKIIRWIFLVTLVLAIALNVSIVLLSNAKAALLDYFRFGYWAILCSMAAIASGICWLYVAGKLQALLGQFAIVGRMTLTHYLTSCLLSALLFSGVGFGIYNTQPMWVYLSVGLLVFLSQVVLSNWWLARYSQGPIEQLWRKLSGIRKVNG